MSGQPPTSAEERTFSEVADGPTRDMNRPERLCHGAFLYIRPSFMITLKFLAGSAIRLIFSNGLPSTRRRSASAPCSTTPSFPGYGFRLPDNASNSAFVAVAMASASAGLYQRTSEARIAPCCCARALEKMTSVPHAVLILYFLASA